MKMSWIRSVALCAALGAGSSTMAAEPAKLYAGLKSADGLLQDMEYLSVKLAKQQTVFNKNIKPNIEIFLIGVSTTLPVGMNVLFSEETGQRTMLQVPVEDLKDDFIGGNLNPIDIEAERDRKDKSLYELTGNAYTGWMRAKGNDSYASISKEKADIPEGVATPDSTLKDLFAKGYDFAAYSLNTEAEAKVRAAAINKLKENRLAGLKKNTEETQEAFDLRKLIISQNTDSIGQLFAETQLIEGGWSTDEAQKLGHGESHWTALPNTDFAKWMTQLGESKSHFASATVHEKSVFSARALVPITAINLANLKKVYELSPTVLKQQIDAEKELSADEKAARAGAVDAGMAALTKSLDLGILDLFLDISPTGEKTHSFVLGLRSVDNRSSIETLVGHLGKVRTGWSSKVGLETVGETQFHSFTVNNAPKAMLDFYGGDGTVYVAAGPEFVGFATGEGSLDGLKKLAEQATTGEKKALDAFVDIRFQARKSLEVTSAFMDEKDFDLLRLMQNSGFNKSKAGATATEKAKEKKGSSASDRISALKNFEWHQTALDAMQGTDDLVTLRMKLVSGAVDSEAKLHEGVLTGLGAVISKFAKENLGGN